MLSVPSERRSCKNSGQDCPLDSESPGFIDSLISKAGRLNGSLFATMIVRAVSRSMVVLVLRVSEQEREPSAEVDEDVEDDDDIER